MQNAFKNTLLAAVACCSLALPAHAYDVFEKSITDLQAALASGEVTSHQLVEGYFARMKAYDQAGPKLNAIVTMNAKALEQADALDGERARKKLRGPLHGIPVLVKDNYETADMPTSAGTLGLATYQSKTDSFAVKRLRAAGAIIIGKTAMHELAAGVTTVSSITGFTRNPYDPARSPGGSSGGTGASIGASFAAAGMGSDTCGSIRIPSAYQNLVGLRGTRGLSSRDGIVPLSSTQDIGGPLARSVTDLAIMLDATVGADPADPITATSKGHIPKSYRDSLVPDGLKGARIGVVKALFGGGSEDKDYGTVVDDALKKMKEQGAEVIEVTIPGLDDMLKDSSVILYEFRYDLADFLAKRPGAPVKTLSEILDKGLAHDQLVDRLRARNPETRDDEAYRKAVVKRRAALEAVKAALEENKLDALAYPTTQRKPNMVGDDANGGSTCQLSATTGLPAMAVAVGFGPAGTPVGMELLGAPFAEATLLKIAYGWEQFAHPRHAPFSTPALVNGRAPAPVTAEVTVPAAQAGGATAHVNFTYDAVTGTLHYAAMADVGKDALVALTLQRGTAEKPMGVIANLILSGQTVATADLVLQSKDREDLAAGHLFVHLYTRQSPLGVGRTAVRFPVNIAQK
jgi:amidase